MNILKLTSIACGLSAMASCSNNQNKVSLAYSGTVTFNADSTVIKSLSQNGFVSYTKNGDEITIESDGKGGVTYSVNNGDKETEVKQDQKELLKEAINGVVKSERGKVSDKK
jgi:hypothetical protein